MPTLVTVPATTGPKSHDTGPEVLLMELPVCVKAVCVRPKMIAIARVISQGVEYLLAAHLSFLLNLEPGVCECREGIFDMFSPEESISGAWGTDRTMGSSSTTAESKKGSSPEKVAREFLNIINRLLLIGLNWAS
jgi:hypothetical protein